MDFTTVSSLVIPEGEVTQIANAAGTVLWTKPNNHLIYTLGETKFDGSNYVNTGIDIQSYSAYTILIDFKMDAVDDAGNMILDNMKELSPWPGWSLDYNKWGSLRFSDSTAKLRSIGGATERNRIVIRRDGNAYTLFSVNFASGGAGNVLEQDIEHPLYVGAYYNMGTISRYMVGTVYSLEIYDEAWSDADCKAWRTQS